MWISLRSWHSRHGNLFTARQIQKCGEQARSVRSFRRVHQGIFESINRYGLGKYDRNWLPRQIHNRHQTASYASPGSRPSPICLASQMELKRAVHLATTLRTICCSDPRRLEGDSVPRLSPRIDGGVFNIITVSERRPIVMETILREMLFADDCAIKAHTLEQWRHQLWGTGARPPWSLCKL